jgi:hypothetical protein
MGGRATARIFHFVNTTRYGIRADVVLHPAISETLVILTTNIPLATYTGARRIPVMVHPSLRIYTTIRLVQKHMPI